MTGKLNGPGWLLHFCAWGGAAFFFEGLVSFVLRPSSGQAVSCNVVVERLLFLLDSEQGGRKTTTLS